MNFIIYGTKGVPVKTLTVTAECPACKANGSIALNILSEHVHIFGIPLAPNDTLAVSQCVHCGQVYTTKHISGFDVFDKVNGSPTVLLMPFEISRNFFSVKKKIRPLWWQFTGIGLIISLIVYALFGEIRADRNTDSYFLNPEVGDIYRIETEDHNYTAFKIRNVTKEGIEVYYNTAMVTQTSAFNKLDDEPFSMTSVPISKVELTIMKENDKIYRIIRE